VRRGCSAGPAPKRPVTIRPDVDTIAHFPATGRRAAYHRLASVANAQRRATGLWGGIVGRDRQLVLLDVLAVPGK